MNKKNIFFSFLLICSSTLFSQGFVVSPLTCNQTIVNKWKTLKAQSAYRAASISDTLDLGTKGIVDDFSYVGPYPDTAIWLDNYAYINRTYGKAPITIGVATLDGLNEKGYPYNFAMNQALTGQADYFTSKPIHLNFPASDSIYFSFYYQPQGIGNQPQAIDSLVLEFKGTGAWKHVWAKKGTALAGNDSSWTLVMIPIKDTSFLKSGFQFRFRNYATLNGSWDHWNIDYVYLKKNRYYNEKQVNDLAYVYNGTPLLKNYTTMPWKQYLPSELRDSVPNFIRNNYTGSDVNISYGNRIDSASTLLYSYPSGASFTIRPFDSTHIYTKCDISLGCLRNVPIDNSIFPATLSGPTKYTFTQYIGTSDSVKANDTLKVEQEFSNYFAYDDGTAEYAFGLSGHLNAKLAEQFRLNVSDTLRCIDIYFNPMETNASFFDFFLNVWVDNNGIPGNLIYSSDTTFDAAYDTNKEGPNNFIRYTLNPPVFINVNTFYIGFTQNTTYPLNVGVDKNNNTQSKIFYWMGSTWDNAPAPGSLMMHPVFGTSAEFVGIENQETKENNRITLYPNPANEKLFFKSNSSNPSTKISYQVLDLYGRIIAENKTVISEPIDISTLSDGVYIVRVVSGDSISTHKFIKVNN